MHKTIRRSFISLFLAFLSFGFLNIAFAGSTTVTDSGIKFPDGTTQTTAATGGSSLWSQSGSNIYYNGGNVGIGTTSPGAKLEVKNDTSSSIDLIRLREKFAGSTDSLRNIAWWDELDQRVAAIGSVFDGTSNNILFHSQWYGTEKSKTDVTMAIMGTGKVGIGTASPSYPLQMASGAHVTTGGVWTDASSRDYKENIRDLTYDEAKVALAELTPSKFNYKVDKDNEYLGFIAEDVPDLVATKDRKGLSPMDVVAVLTKVLQKQQEIVERQQEESQLLKAKIQGQNVKIDALERRLVYMNQ